MEINDEQISDVPDSGEGAAEEPPAPEIITYVTYDADGILDGYYIQPVIPEHADRYIQIFPPLAQHFLSYRANAARDGLELIPPAPPSIEQLTARFKTMVQSELDSRARAYGYDTIITAVTYADEDAVPQFQAEGRALRRWRSLVWQHCREMLAQVAGGGVAIPTESEVLASLPALVVDEPESPAA